MRNAFDLDAESTFQVREITLLERDAGHDVHEVGTDVGEVRDAQVERDHGVDAARNANGDCVDAMPLGVANDAKRFMPLSHGSPSSD
jgi:hypothetical protein